MKLFEKLAALRIEQPRIGHREAERLFAKAVKEHGGFTARFRAAREHAINAGFDFLLARAGFDHGQWLQQCQLYSAEISERSIQRYMQLADLSWRWAIYKNPRLKTPDEIRAKAIEMVLVSPKPIVELCREIGLMLKFGEYYPDDYAQKKKDKLLANGQVEFDFTVIDPALQMICNHKITLPDDLAKLRELEGTLKSAQIRVAHRLKELEAK